MKYIPGYRGRHQGLRHTKKEVAYRMQGHTDTVTSLAVSPDAQSLLSYSHDGLARTWDIKPFAPVDRSLKTYSGAPVGVERNLIRASWDPKGERVTVGSGDGSVCVWDKGTAKLVYKLPGHKGTVNDVQFSPGDEPIIVSCSSDWNLLLGELGASQLMLRVKKLMDGTGDAFMISTKFLLPFQANILHLHYNLHSMMFTKHSLRPLFGFIPHSLYSALVNAVHPAPPMQRMLSVPKVKRPVTKTMLFFPGPEPKSHLPYLGPAQSIEHKSELTRHGLSPGPHDFL